MIDNVRAIISSYETLQNKLYDWWWTLSHDEYVSLGKELNALKDRYDLSKIYISLYEDIQEAKNILRDSSDDDMIVLAKDQLSHSENALLDLEDKLKIALLPQDPNDFKDVFVEIRPAAGWDESSLFGQELLRMYSMYAQSKWWKSDLIEYQASDVWWLKFAVLKIVWDKVYSYLKYESGVHRVQRIPDTESNGRIHTSTVTVAIMPEATDIDVHIDMADIQLDTYAASSSGWQNANKNQTGVRLHHGPTWIIVTIGDSKSQLQNKEKAFAVLKAKLYQRELDLKLEKEKNLRWSQVGTGDRSEKIRTYNFPQDRITDHRIKESWSNIPYVLAGNLDDIIHSLIVAQQTSMLRWIS